LRWTIRCRVVRSLQPRCAVRVKECIMEERLDFLRRKIKSRDVYYSSYNPRAEFMHDVEDAKEDFLWMLFEIERLRDEIVRLKERE